MFGPYQWGRYDLLILPPSFPYGGMEHAGAIQYRAESLLLEDVPFIPLYTDVTKRMVNPRLKGCQSNVMDHHYSKHMFFLKAAPDETPAQTEANEVIDTVTAAAESLQEIVVPRVADEAELIEVNPEPVPTGDDAERVTPLQEPDPQLEENNPEVHVEDLPPDGETEGVTTPEDTVE